MSSRGGATRAHCPQSSSPRCWPRIGAAIPRRRCRRSTGRTRSPPRRTDSQRRSSGESYINHPLAVAQIVADIGLDEISVAAALLHDAVEDTEITDRRRRTSTSAPRSPAIVDGVTKLERIQFDSREAQQAATMRKMLVAMAQGPAGARDQARRPAPQHAHPRRHAAREAAADRPGDARHLRPAGAPARASRRSSSNSRTCRSRRCIPKRYAELDHLVATRTPERDLYLAKAVAELRTRLAELGIEAEVTGRGKHLWSIYEKMVVKGREFDDIFDIVAVRVIVDSIKDCYAALGASTVVGARSSGVSRTTSRCPSSTSTRACTRR